MTRTIVAHPTGHPRNAAAARRRARARQRAGGRGIAVLWLLAALPVFLLVLIFLLDIANLWLARVELENGLESAALSAVKEWGDAGGGDTLVPRTVGVAYAQANRVRAVPLTLVTNYGPADGPNQNLTCCVTAGTWRISLCSTPSPRCRPTTASRSL